MPELPEVESTRLGLVRRIAGKSILRVTVRNPELRWPVSPELEPAVSGQRLTTIERRGKVLVFRLSRGAFLVHLGMSGRLYFAENGSPVHRHDHLWWHFEDDLFLRYRDPRRFGAVLWCEAEPSNHPLLSALGPEPFDPEFNGCWLYGRSRGRRSAVKAFLMDGRTVAGVGNIYATESLYRAGIHPARAAGRISRTRYVRLASAVQAILAAAITQGGTTFRDYRGTGGEPGRFAETLAAYGRAGEPCQRCGMPLRRSTIAQRTTVYCPRC